ncbi:uncharacterized protein LOC135464658 [Liolophura sinensis]|uniref:uncharacterized protein LOC135464658 n=1 Tax=Liolophura sinensis TaxID=3198878 RepID=UPI0031583872
MDTFPDSTDYQQMEQFLENLYGGLPYYRGVEIANITTTDGETVTTHRVLYNRPVTPREEWNTAILLKDYVNENLYYEYGTMNRPIENATYLVRENGEIVDVVSLLEREWRTCYLYQVLAACENGAYCYADQYNRPSCRCPANYWGEYCRYYTPNIVYADYVDKSLLTLTLAGNVSSDPSSPEYQSILEFFRQQYGGLSYYRDVEILDMVYEGGETKITHVVNYNRPVTARQEWQTATILKDYVNSNLYFDQGAFNASIQNATYIVLDTQGQIVHEDT